MAVRQVTGAVGTARAVRRWGESWLDSGQAMGADRDRVIATAVASLIEAVGAKDSYTRWHSRRVGRYAQAIARGLGLSARDEGEVALAGELHDVGKIGVPDELLHKTGPLTREERCRVLDHTVIGERILAPLLADRPAVLAAVRWHHEWMDGSGYPDGLQGRFIPLIPRILAVADAFDAMTSARPYRPPLARNVALAELKRGVGAQFDPECVRVFLALPPGRPAGRVLSHAFPAVARRIRRWEREPAPACA
jgi:HD-GYP domain-containing protein (c-di-GMP phosphodiesterase class II)